NLGFLRLGRRLGDDLVGRLVRAQALEGRLPHVAVAGPAGELDLGHQLGLGPVQVALVARAGRLVERALLAFDVPELRQQLLHHAFAETGTDPADIDELVAAMHADQQRAQLLALLRPAPDHHFVAGPAL